MSEFWRGCWTGIGSVTVFTVAALAATVLVQYLADLRETVWTCRWCPYRTSTILGRMRWHLHRHHRDIQRTFEALLDQDTGWAEAEREASKTHPDQRWSGDSVVYVGSIGGRCHYCKKRYHRWSRVRGDSRIMHEHCWTAAWVDEALEIVLEDIGLTADLAVTDDGIVIAANGTPDQVDYARTILADCATLDQDPEGLASVHVLTSPHG